MCDCANRVTRRSVVLAGAASLFLPAVAFATEADDRTKTITGRFEPGAPDWVYLPVEVPRGVREIEVVYRYDKPSVPPGANGNALDIGIFGPEGHGLGDHRGFRGWSGGARDRFTISASDATPGYLPGPIDAGTWHVVLGPYTVAPQGMNYQVDVTLRFGAPGRPARPNPAPQHAEGRGRAWYRGDCHLHTVHSDGRRTPAELVAAARAAGLDFFVSTEHNTSSASLRWGDHARPDLLIINGEEITTRSGHWPALGLPPGYWVDWRYRHSEPGAFDRFARRVRSVGGLVVAAHPHCPFVGCSWEFGYDHVDAIEVWNGDWTQDDEGSVRLWDALLRAGRWVPAIGASDAHREPQPVGLPHTVVLADGLDTRAILAGVAAGRSWLAESARVDLAMKAVAGRREAGIGDRLRVAEARIELDVSGVPGCEVRLITPTGVAHTARVPDSGRTEVRWTTTAAWVRAEVRRPVPTATTPDTMVAMTNPVFLGRR
ncbi:CehA/McbA family metallohydrolase [Allokutzneria oryzae]|uniref:CehA/McbA family metallohydrolase n=1 Tax=Allokutzneria oryzae TaxID=1378989 RepID=A0ABV5ZZC4_9PSEU